MKRCLILTLAILALACVVQADEPLPVTVGAVDAPPEGMIELLDNGGFEDGWTAWDEPTANPFVWLSTLDSYEGVWHMVQGSDGNDATLDEGCHGTYQTIDLAACDPTQSVLVYRAMSIETFDLDPSAWTVSEGSFFREDWVSIARLWTMHEEDTTGGAWRYDIYEVRDLHEAAASYGGSTVVHLLVSTCVSEQAFVRYGYDAFSVKCPAKPIEFTHTVFLPLVQR
jgi:hypothetical protein